MSINSLNNGFSGDFILPNTTCQTASMNNSSYHASKINVEHFIELFFKKCICFLLTTTINSSDVRYQYNHFFLKVASCKEFN